MHFFFERMVDLSLKELEEGFEHLEQLIRKLRGSHHRRHRAAPRSPFLIGVNCMSTVTLVDVLPTTRKDNSTLSPSEIQSITFQKASLEGSPPELGAPVVLQTNSQVNGNPLQPSDLTFTDNSPQPGDTYTSFVTDTAGHIGDPSNAFVVPATLAAPSAPQQTGTFTP